MLQTQSVQTQSASSEAVIERAHLLMLRGQYDEAKSLLQTVLTTEPGNEAARRMLDDIHAKTMPAVATASVIASPTFKARAKFWLRVPLGVGWIGVCAWNLLENILYALANGFGAAMTVHSHHGTSHYPVWYWIIIMGAGIGLGVRFLYWTWLDHDEE